MQKLTRSRFLDFFFNLQPRPILSTKGIDSHRIWRLPRSGSLNHGSLEKPTPQEHKRDEKRGRRTPCKSIVLNHQNAYVNLLLATHFRPKPDLPGFPAFNVPWPRHTRQWQCLQTSNRTTHPIWWQPQMQCHVLTKRSKHSHKLALRFGLEGKRCTGCTCRTPKTCLSTILRFGCLWIFKLRHTRPWPRHSRHWQCLENFIRFGSDRSTHRIVTVGICGCSATSCRKYPNIPVGFLSDLIRETTKLHS